MAEQVQKQDKDFKYLVRIINTDLDGNKQIVAALRKIKGVSYSFANAICVISGVEKSKKAGILSEEEIKKIEHNLKNSPTLLPQWILNRRKDLEEGFDRHIFTTDLDYSLDNDIKLMKKIRSYRGVRHGMGAPVRGQRTRSNFRKNKGKVLGVVKKKVGGKAG